MLTTNWVDPLLNLVFPSPCVVCGTWATTWRSGAICPECEAGLKPLKPPYCTRCGLPAAGVEGLCGPCLGGKTRYDFGRAALQLDPAARRIIHHFKYNDRVSLARPLGRALRATLEAGGFQADCVVPVPLHRRRERQRGYNQSRLLADRLGMRVDPGLVRRRLATESQTGKSRSQRVRNVRGAFECLRPVDGCILLVDDVQTTGATLNEIARLLKRQGARRVEVLTVVRVGLSDGVDRIAVAGS